MKLGVASRCGRVHKHVSAVATCVQVVDATRFEGEDVTVLCAVQIMILFGVAAVGATACTACILLATMRLTDAHHRLRLDRLADHNYHAFKWMWCGTESLVLVHFSVRNSH